MGYYYVNPIMWALAISLATMAGAWAFVSYRRRAYRSAVRGVALVLLSFGLLLTGSLTLAMRILEAFTQWASRLVFSPMVWIGLGLVAGAVGLLVMARKVPGGGSRRSRKVRAADQPALGAAATGKGQPVDAEMAEIEAILRKRGIT